MTDSFFSAGNYSPGRYTGVLWRYSLQLLINLGTLWVLMASIEPLLHVQGFRGDTASVPPVLTFGNWLGLLGLGVSYLGFGWLFGKLVLRSAGAGLLTRTGCGLTLLAVPLFASLLAAAGCFVCIAHSALWPVPVAALTANSFSSGSGAEGISGCGL